MGVPSSIRTFHFQFTFSPLSFSPRSSQSSSGSLQASDRLRYLRERRGQSQHQGRACQRVVEQLGAVPELSIVA